MLDSHNRITDKKTLNEWLAYERKFYPCSSLQRFFKIGEGALLWHHQVLLRKTEYHLNVHHKVRYLVYKFFLRRTQLRYAIHIPLNCCDKGLHIVHIGPVLMNNQVTVGKDCSFHINTALVAGGNNDFAPKLGNRVIVGVGAVVLGNVEVADYVAIGANSVVNRSVTEENIAVAGAPARKISSNGTKTWNVKNKE